MLRRRRDRTAGRYGFRGRLGAYGPRRDHVRGERPVLVREPPGPIHALFAQHMGGPDMGLHLIALPVVRDRPLTPSDPFRVETQHPVTRPAGWTGPMQIGRLRDRNARVVAREIVLQALIRRRQGCAPRPPPLFDHPILEGVDPALHPALGLRGVGVDQRNPPRPPRSPKRTLGVPPRPLFLECRLGRRVVSALPVCVDGQGNPVLRHVALEAVPRWARALVRLDPRIHPAARSVHIGHQPAAGPPALHPVMVRAVQLDECPHLRTRHAWCGRFHRVTWSMPASRNQPRTVSARSVLPWRSASFSAANVESVPGLVEN